MRIVQAPFGMPAALTAAVGGLWLLARPAPTFPDLTAQSAEQAAGLARSLLAADPANPYHWSDLGEALAESGRFAEARSCFRRAAELGPNIPPVLMRAAAFHIRAGEARAALPLMLHIMELIPDYDAIIFYYCDRLIPIAELLPPLARNPRAARSHFRFLLDSGNVEHATAAWASLREHGLAEDELAAAYLDLLLRHGRHEQALRAWVAWLGPRAGEYPERNLIYNGGFESQLTGSPLDWRIQPLAGAEAVRDSSRAAEGRTCLRLSFAGTVNPNYSHVTQLVYLPAGRFRLTARIRSEQLTTDQGLFLRISEAAPGGRQLAETEQVMGTTDWRTLETTFAHSQSGLAAVQICRRPSRKFDSKIRGVVWVDAVRLERQP